MKIGFSSVSIPAAAQSYVQLPSIKCTHIKFGLCSNNIAVALSASPGNSYMSIPATGALVVEIPVTKTAGVDGNANLLFIANDTGTAAQTVRFMWEDHLA